ncbi:MAG TPA: hypothetical protein VHU87_13910 [Rhizomicrobium sp.]|jgi:hypothetical protein|nr:hypothetical protein [Rhizomicrobium sp.]
MLDRIFVALVFVCAASAALAAAPGWNGTWIGNWEDGNGAQIVFAGDTLTGIFWDGDYVSNAAGIVSKDGKTVAITWAGATAILTRDTATTAHIVIHEAGKPDTAFAVKKGGS